MQAKISGLGQNNFRLTVVAGQYYALPNLHTGVCASRNAAVLSEPLFPDTVQHRLQLKRHIF